MADRLITPSQLALFSRSPVIGAWWEELHATTPERAPRPDTAALDAFLFDSGLQHEQVLIARLEQAGHSVVRLRGRQNQDDYDATLAAMRSGADYIWQASLRNNEMRGSADLLERIERPSLLGDWSYIPIECKLSSHPKPIYLVQACAYGELLESILGHRPEHFKLYLGGGRFEEGEQGYPTARFWSWYLQLRQRYRSFRAGFDPSQEPEDAPGDHGLWDPFIQQRLEAKRDLILVATMRQSQRQKLRAAGITSMDALAAWPEDRPVPGLDPAMLVRLRDQARIQCASALRSDGRPAFEVRPSEQQSRGLAMLPRRMTATSGSTWRASRTRSVAKSSNTSLVPATAPAGGRCCSRAGGPTTPARRNGPLLASWSGWKRAASGTPICTCTTTPAMRRRPSATWPHATRSTRP